MTGAPAPNAASASPPRALAVSRSIAGRSVLNIRRLPSTFVPAAVEPIFQVVSLSGTFFAITLLPGFPTDRSVNWFLPLAVLLGSVFAGSAAGLTTIRDIESGFFDRLRMAPVPRRSLILGALLSAWVRALLVVTVVVAVGTALGARLTDGPGGIVILYVTGLGMSTIGTGWGLGLAYRFKSMRAAAPMQLGIFVTLFLTEAEAPLDVIRGWLHTVARINPFTNVLRLARVGYLGDITWDDTWGGLVALTVIAVLAVWFARRGLAHLEA